MRGRKKHPSNKEDNTQWVNTEKIEKQTQGLSEQHSANICGMNEFIPQAFLEPFYPRHQGVWSGAQGSEGREEDRKDLLTAMVFE